MSQRTQRPRRDLFAEREIRRNRGQRVTGNPVTEGRQGRRRLDRSLLSVHLHNGRVLRDPHQARSGLTTGALLIAGAGSVGHEHAPQQLPLRRVEIPSAYILVVPELDNGQLGAVDLDLFGAARLLADRQDAAVIALICVSDTAKLAGLDLASAGADRVVPLVDSRLAGFAPELTLAGVMTLVEQFNPLHLLFADSLTGGGDLGRRVAVELGDRGAGNVQVIKDGQITRRGCGGKNDIVMAPPRVLMLAGEVAEPVKGERFEARSLPPLHIDIQPRLTDQGLAAIDPNAVALVEADFIVSAGNGVSDWQGFHGVARALGATEAGSRVVCDAGHLHRDRQVGASGTLVEPRCYIAFGIAGAQQHISGIEKCERVVAVNTDLYADMVKRADLAIIADAQQVMPALQRLLEEKSHA